MSVASLKQRFLTKLPRNRLLRYALIALTTVGLLVAACSICYLTVMLVAGYDEIIRPRIESFQASNDLTQLSRKVIVALNADTLLSYGKTKITWGGSMVCVSGDKTITFESTRSIDQITQDLADTFSQKDWKSNSYTTDIDGIETNVTSFSNAAQSWRIVFVPGTPSESNHLDYSIKLQYCRCCEWRNFS